MFNTSEGTIIKWGWDRPLPIMCFIEEITSAFNNIVEFFKLRLLAIPIIKMFHIHKNAFGCHEICRI